MSPSKAINIDFNTFYNVVDGKHVGSKNIHNGINPATQEKLWDVPIAGQQDVDDAVEAGLKAFKTWSQTPIEKRKELMLKFVDLYSGYQEEFTTLMCKETGKPKQFAQGEVAGCMDMIKHHASLDIPVETFENDERSVTTTFVPLGVVGAICPWNFPMLLAVGKIAPAMLSGMIRGKSCAKRTFTDIPRLHNHHQAISIHSIYSPQTRRTRPRSLPPRRHPSPRRR
jgi:acyl-CoA reductase-like NAD-dependent aldehyde dehydrogenase